MTLYSKINFIIAFSLVVIGVLTKTILYLKRKKLDGFHGYCTKQTDNLDEVDEWQNI